MNDATTARARNSDKLRRLADDELERVSGGMKWTRNTANSDVIDARGGQIKVLGFTFTFDVNGKVSSVS